jgi:hypothetical protein
MANLPKDGWLQRCEKCDAVTSRLVIIRNNHRQFQKYGCRGCRRAFLSWLFSKFDYVYIIRETAACIEVRV